MTALSRPGPNGGSYSLALTGVPSSCHEFLRLASFVLVDFFGIAQFSVSPSNNSLAHSSGVWLDSTDRAVEVGHEHAAVTKQPKVKTVSWQRSSVEYNSAIRQNLTRLGQVFPNIACQP